MKGGREKRTGGERRRGERWRDSCCGWSDKESRREKRGWEAWGEPRPAEWGKGGEAND